VIAGYVPGKGFTTTTLQMNQRITQAYAQMYLSNPQVFKWAGMAAFASKEVGMGERQAEALAGSDLPWIPGLTDISGTKLEAELAQGNLGVFSDIYWQHLAYQDGGIGALKQALDAHELDRTAFDAWQTIDRGQSTGNQDLVWQGNASLLRYEQQNVLQPSIYDSDRSTWQKMSSWPISWVQHIESPIPGDNMSFNNYKGGGDIGNFDDRWRWISESMLPAWKRLDSNPQQAVPAIEALTK